MDVTAVLITSIALVGATGVVGVPAHAPSTVSSSIAAAAPAGSETASVTRSAADPASAAGRSAAVDASSANRSALDAEVGSAIASSVPAASLDAGVAASGISDQLRLARTVTAIGNRLAPTRGVGATFGGSALQSVSASLLPRLAGRALLDQLSLLPGTEIAEFVDEQPSAVSGLLLDPPSARSVSSWWSLTTDDAREALLVGAPELVGNLDGLSPSLRDTANRAFLRESIRTAEDELRTLGRAETADAKQRLHMLNEIEDSLVTTVDEPERTLLSVDTAWPGRAAVVIGDLETADYVSYMVPGMFFTVDGQMVDWTVISQDLYDEQSRWVRTLGGEDRSLTDASVAVVSWIGYQTPGITDVVSLDLAEVGARYISSSVNGLYQTRSDREPRVTLVTHSYGSTATLMALQQGALEVDSLVIIGSPGSAAQSVDDIRMPADDVYVGEAAWDPVVNSAFFGSDPGSDAFGASAMSVAGGEDPITGRALSGATGHLGYFDAGTEAMRNMALVGLGRGDLVTGGSVPSPGVQLADGK